jgi:hypothetical protein
MIIAGRNRAAPPPAQLPPGSYEVSVTRMLVWRDCYRVQFSAEAFNLFNRVNISQFDNIFPPDAQGNYQLPPRRQGRYIVPRERYRGAFAPRQFQLGIRVSF